MLIYYFYQLLWFFLPPLIKLRLLYKSLRNKDYLAYWRERFGGSYLNPLKNCLWIHAVSVGEVRASEPLISLWRQRYPDFPVLLTQMTPTGRQIAQNLFPFAQCRYLPYDKKKYCRRFLAAHQPLLALFMETEIWPNWLFSLRQQEIPVFLVNGRLSVKSYQNYARFLGLITPALNSFSKIYAQTAADKKNFALLGAKSVAVTGNTKYDCMLAPHIKELSLCFQKQITTTARKIVVCGSTRVKDGVNEAFLLLDEWARQQNPALLIIVPRHPEVFNAVVAYAQKLGFHTVRRSDNPVVGAEVQVVVGDSMGELSAYYLLADVAFVGGSLVDGGGQNIIESLQCGVPTVFGFSVYNFAEVAAAALAAQCALQVKDASAWYQCTAELLTAAEQCRTMRAKALGFVADHQGAAVKIVTELGTFINKV